MKKLPRKMKKRFKRLIVFFEQKKIEFEKITQENQKEKKDNGKNII